MKNEIAKVPSYWACVSGGKDSLYMLYYILHHQNQYPLNGVVHFELEIDYPFIHDVINEMEKECKRFGIPFMRIRPSKTWEELYNKNGFPSSVARWCNSAYKLDARRKHTNWLHEHNLTPVWYIGYCVDEVKRYSNRKGAEIYPLVDAGIEESAILSWAKHQPIFNHFYETHRRCGCMYCPMASKLEFAYLYKYYPDNFDYMIEKMKLTEKSLFVKYGRKISVTSGNPKYNADYLENIIKTKWIKKLNELEEQNKNENL